MRVMQSKRRSEPMRKLIRPVLLGAALSMGVAAFTTVAAEGIKVGAVNLTKVTEQMPQADAAQKQLEREFAPRQRELETQQKELRAMEERLDRDTDVMSESERRGLERDIRSFQRELVRLQREVREDYNIRRNEELRKLLNPDGKVPDFEACATTGQGVFETLKATAKMILKDLRNMSR